VSGSKHRLLDAIAIWQGRNYGLLAETHVQSRLVGPTAGRSKNSVAVEFISSHSLVAATVWDSGECEVITTSVQDDQTQIRE